MLDNMNSAQTIYTVFFALYYAVTIGTTSNLKLIDTAVMCYGFMAYPKSWIRFILSMGFINVIPLFFFWITINKLASIPGDYAYTNFGVLLIIFLQSIIGFGLYRILFGMLLFKNRDGSYYFYDTPLYEDNEYRIEHPIKAALKNRPKLHSKWIVHIVPGVIWVAFTFFLLLLI